MPTVNEYKDSDGFYIRSAKGGSISTYQVTSEGQELLRSQGVSDGHSISHAKLDMLARRGLVYTNGGGAGQIDQAATVTIEIVGRASTPSGKRSLGSQQSDAAGCAFAAAALGIFGLIGLIDLLSRQPASISIPIAIGLGILTISVLAGMVTGSSEKSFITLFTLALSSVSVVVLYKTCVFIGTWSFDVWVLLSAATAIAGTFWWLAVSLQKDS
ncbi:sugar porter family MFS transporter [Paludisphaera soli]|uniref:sugar porter family MFS transporter n=1 Tax=Paludisphaera soli TaxID=2712865 RepID=UPI0013EA7CBD|nr:sugar porter family MFS transporter [Paludisphaera soli]